MIAVVVGIIAVVALTAAIIFQPWKSTPFASGREDTNSAKPTGSQWDERIPTETPSPPEDPDDQGSPVDCPQNSTEMRSEASADGRLHGGNLSFESAGSFHDVPVYMPWLYDHNSQTRSIVSGWMSNLSVGYIRKDEGFKAPRSSAEQLMGCLATSDLYMGFEGREDIRSEAFSLDGREGWRLTANVYVTRDDGIRGDVVDIVVLDTGRIDEWSVYISCATIDHEENLAEVERAFESLRVG